MKRNIKNGNGERRRNWKNKDEDGKNLKEKGVRDWRNRGKLRGERNRDLD